MHIVPGPVSGGHRDRILRAAFSPDGDRFVAGDAKGGLIVHGRAGGILTQTQVPAAGPYSKPQIHSVAWSPDGARIAAAEYGEIRLRRPADLSVEAELKGSGKLQIAFSGGGRRLAVLSNGCVRTLGIADPKDSTIDSLGPRGDYEYFHANTLATDPGGDLIAAGDDGGCNETAMGATLGRGESQVTLLPSKVAIETGNTAHQIEFDPWRRLLWVSTYGDVGLWSASGDLVRRFKLYPGAYAAALAITEAWIATTSSAPPHSIELWHPETLARLGSVAHPKFRPEWLTASPDGRTLLSPDFAAKDDFGVRIWSVE